MFTGSLQDIHPQFVSCSCTQKHIPHIQAEALQPLSPRENEGNGETTKTRETYKLESREASGLSLHH